MQLLGFLVSGKMFMVVLNEFLDLLLQLLVRNAVVLLGELLGLGFGLLVLVQR
jgi:hypothetical protein